MNEDPAVSWIIPVDQLTEEQKQSATGTFGKMDEGINMWHVRQKMLSETAPQIGVDSSFKTVVKRLNVELKASDDSSIEQNPSLFLQALENLGGNQVVTMELIEQVWNLLDESAKNKIAAALNSCTPWI